ncbi:MAG: hypothetical protein OEU32_02520 [Acidimicrobiia bacterium]|nr:hypothetical protein [Acidimicrobiia bacterium]
MEATSTPTRGATGRYGPVAVATITMALVTWPIAFNLGAYGAVFYDDVFRFVVAATVAFAVAVAASPYAGRARWLALAALVAPAVWLVLSVLLFDSTAAAASDPVFGVVGLVVAVVSIPTVLKLLMDLFVPELTSLDDTRLMLAAAAMIALVAASGFAVGTNNDAFLTCDDFVIAGSTEPTNCSRG